jgi:hypothetical protein
MPFLMLHAYTGLIAIERYLQRRDFAALHQYVREFPLSRRRPDASITTQRVSAAVDMACIWYWKQVLCLQRSAATACLLKAYGISAQLVIGVRSVPFQAHAWVEVNGEIVNDRPYLRESYAVLERC